MTDATLTLDTAAAVIRRLTVGQISTIMGLTGQPVLLACSEPCAKNLTRGSKTRPALVDKVWSERVSLYALNADGLVVRAALDAVA